MDLHSFPMDKQSCPLILGSYGYPNDQLIYKWDIKPVTFNQKDFTLSSFDIVKTIYRNGTFSFKRGNHSMLQANFNLRRHVGYFLIQIYVPCSLIVVLSWVSFWINREATADRVGLGVTSVLTLSTFGMDSRNDLPRVSYATALDWYTVMCFLFVVFTLLEFAGVHYFTKFGTGEVPFIELDKDWSRNSDTDDQDDTRYTEFAHRRRMSRFNEMKIKTRMTKLRSQIRHRSVKSGIKLSGQRRVNPTAHLDGFDNWPEFYPQTEYFSEEDEYGFKMKEMNNHPPPMRSKYRGAPSNNPRQNNSNYHMPSCPENPGNDDNVQWGSGYLHENFDEEHKTYLENYVLQRLRSAGNVVYPIRNENDLVTMQDNVRYPTKLASSWPSLVWNDYSNKARSAQSFGGSDGVGLDCNIQYTPDQFFDDMCIGSEFETSNRLTFWWKTSIYFISHCCVQFWYCFTANEQYKLEMKRRGGKGHGPYIVNSVSLIDKVSRILFPLVFFVLNLGYWSYYIHERSTDFNQF